MLCGLKLIPVVWITLLLFSVFGYASADDETIEECREHCTAAPHGKCYGTAGNELTIPCTGPTGSPLDPPYDYINITNDGVKEILLSNSSYLLTINLTSNHDNSRIYCESVALGSGSVIYQLSVCYAPIRVPIKDIPRRVGYGNYLKEKTLKCPLYSNPPMNCSWYLFRCVNIPPRELSTPYYGVEYTDNGCTIVIKELTHNYSNICFECNGTNLLGSNWGNYNSIDFTTCNQEPVMYVYDDDTGSEVENNSSLTVYAGDSVTFKCNLFGGNIFGQIFWYRDLNFSTWKYTENNTFDKYLCLWSGFIRLTNLTLDDSGFYTCSYGTIQYPIAVTFELIVAQDTRFSSETFTVAPDDQPSVFIPPSVAGGLSFLLLLLIIVSLSILYARKRANSDGESQYTALLDDFEEEFDVFLSFAEEDAAFVERNLKLPLEERGYSICWHHTHFLAGCSIAENIERSVYKSRVTIVALSHSFAESQFCLRELSVVSQKMKQRKSKNCLLPVIIDKGCEEKLVKHLKITHINYDDERFIYKVTSSLGNPVFTRIQPV